MSHQKPCAAAPSGTQEPSAKPPRKAPRTGEPIRKPAALSNLPHKGSAEARRLAALLLEVLAGVRSPPEAAAALGVSLPRYYVLEARALEGFLGGCRPLGRGPRVTPEREILKLRRELMRRERECARYQALLRLSQRAVGLPPRGEKVREKEPGRKRRRRRPVARALKAARVLAPQQPAMALEKGAGKEDDVGSERA